MSEDSSDRELWMKRTNELVQKIRVSGKRTITTSKPSAENVKRKDASFPFQSPKNDHSNNSFKTTRTKQTSIRMMRTSAKTQTLLSFFARLNRSL